MNGSITTVFIIDDDAAVRESLALLLEQEGLTVNAFDSAESFLSYCQPVLSTCLNECNGCIVCDINMPGMDGMEFHQVLKERSILLPIIFLTGNGNIPMSVRAIKAGAVDFLTKPVSRETLLKSVRSALKLEEEILEQASSKLQIKALLNGLTEREREVMALAVIGLPNKEIARQLGISFRTVEIHKTNIMRKTGSKNLLELARLAQDGELNISKFDYPE